MTLKLENIILQGSASNNVALIRIGSSGTLLLDTGAEITGNTSSGERGGGVLVDGGTLAMRGGRISNNIGGTSYGGYGGGVYVGTGRFIMQGGTISGNRGSTLGGFGGGDWEKALQINPNYTKAKNNLEVNEGVTDTKFSL
jgi:hypothetical protein